MCHFAWLSVLVYLLRFAPIYKMNGYRLATKVKGR